MSKDLLVVLPVLDAQWAWPCIDSILDPKSSAGFAPDRLLVVDNTREGLLTGAEIEPCVCLGSLYYTHQHPECPYHRRAILPGVYRGDVRMHRDPDGHNLGVARSWNLGAREVLAESLDYLVLVSASMRFGPILHTTWVEQMERFWGETVIECDGHSWHLIAFHRRVFERVGLFDENFYPAYVEGLDFSYRMRQMGLEGGWRRCWVNAMSAGVAYHVDNQIVACPFGPLDAYYQMKWGGPKGEETHTLPFGDQPLDYFPDYPIPELARKYGLGERGVGWW